MEPLVLFVETVKPGPLEGTSHHIQRGATLNPSRCNRSFISPVTVTPQERPGT